LKKLQNKDEEGMSEDEKKAKLKKMIYFEKMVEVKNSVEKVAPKKLSKQNHNHGYKITKDIAEAFATLMTAVIFIIDEKKGDD